MKKLISYSLLFLFSILFFTTCKKYKEDNFITFHRPIARILGSWQLVSVTINGVDSTQQFIPTYRTGYSLYFTRNGSSWWVSMGNYKGAGTGPHEFSFDSKKNLKMPGFLVYPDNITGDPTYYILELYKTDLKFTITHPDNGKVYVFVYQKVN